MWWTRMVRREYNDGTVCYFEGEHGADPAWWRESAAEYWPRGCLEEPTLRG